MSSARIGPAEPGLGAKSGAMAANMNICNLFLQVFFFLESAGELRFIILRRKIGGTSPKGYRDKGTVTLPKKNQV